MTALTFHSIALWGLVLFFLLIVCLFIHPASRKWMLESRDLPSRRSRLSASLSDLIEWMFYPVFWLIKIILRILD